MMETVDQISARLKDLGADVPKEEIQARLKLLVETFRVPEDEARRSVLNYFLKEKGISPAKAFTRETVEMKIGDVAEPGRWVNLRAKVVQLWENNNEAIAQSGLVGDETGVVKFVKWEKADLPELEEGKSYTLKNVVTDEFQGRFSVKLNRTSEIIPLDEEIETADRAQTEDTKIGDVAEPGRWVNLRAKVVQLWENNSEAIAQSGLVGDETGVIKFVKWEKADLPELEEGKSYTLKNVVTDEFQDRFSVKLNRTSEVVPLDEEIEVGSQVAEFGGAIVDIQKGSGLIKRCPVCRRSLAKGICGEHGKVEGQYDLRIKGVMDDGSRVQDILVNRETTENLIGLPLEEAKQMAMEALDHEVIRSLIEERLVGRYYQVTGARIDRYILVETISERSPVAKADVESLIGEVS